MMSQRHAIVTALLRVASDMGCFKLVSEWKMSDIAPAQCPSLTVRDTVDQISRTQYQMDNHDLSIEVQIKTTGEDAIRDLRYYLSDYTQALAGNKTLDATCEKFTTPAISIGADEQGKQIAIGNINMIVNYETAIGSQ